MNQLLDHLHQPEVASVPTNHGSLLLLYTGTGVRTVVSQGEDLNEKLVMFEAMVIIII